MSDKKVPQGDSWKFVGPFTDSGNTRQLALEYAVGAYRDLSPEEVLDAARLFEGFLNGGGPSPTEVNKIKDTLRQCVQLLDYREP